VQSDADHLKEVLEEKDEEAQELRDATAEQRRSYEREMQAEIRAIQGQLDTQVRESGTSKAQIALLQTQLQQAESQRLEERSRSQAQLQHTEEDLKREYSRRDQERTQYWENVIGQVRSEKESLRGTLLNREEELSRLQMELAEQRRTLDVERGRLKNEMDQMRQEARAEALRNLPEAYEQRVGAEHKQWEQQHLIVVQPLKAQLSQAQESQKALAAKLDVESRRSEQEIQQLREQLQSVFQEREAIQNANSNGKISRSIPKNDRRCAWLSISPMATQWPF